MHCNSSWKKCFFHPPFRFVSNAQLRAFFAKSKHTHTSQVLRKNVHAIVCLLKNAYGCRPLIKDSCIKVLLFPYDEILTSFTCQQPSLLAPPPPYYDDACFGFYFVHNHLSLHSTTNAFQRTCRRNVQVWNTVRGKKGGWMRMRV